MEERTEQRKHQPLIHGRMIYRCEQCGKSWPMYLEKGIEEFGTNHKPSPFTITCPYCGGFAMDVSGIQKVPGGGYVPLPEGYGYFANVGNRDCGVPTFPARAAKKEHKRKTKILIADELDKSSVGAMARDRIFGGLRECLEELNSLFDGDSGQKGEFLDLTTAWDREETREIRRAQDRESLSRFRQYRTDENRWATQKRTGARRREWRGPWRETKRTN